MGVRRGGGGRRTSLTSAQCEPLPVKPSGQGPQRAPLAVSVQATPGKQKPGEHWLSGRTVSLGVRAGCIPAGSGARVVKATPRGGAYRDRASHLGKILPVPRPHPVLSAPLSRSLQSLDLCGRPFFFFLSASPCATPPPSISRKVSGSLGGLPLPQSLSLLSVPLSPSLIPSLHLCQPPSSSLSLLLPVCPLTSGSVLSPHLFSLPGHPVSAAPAALTARVTLHHRVFQERNLLDLWCKGDGVWSAGLHPSSPPPVSPLPLSDSHPHGTTIADPLPTRLPTPRSLLSQPLFLLPWDFLLPSRIRTLSRRAPPPWDPPPPSFP